MSGPTDDVLRDMEQGDIPHTHQWVDGELLLNGCPLHHDLLGPSRAAAPSEFEVVDMPDGHPSIVAVPSPDRVAGLREALIADLDTFIRYVDNPSMGRDTPAMLEEVGRVAARHAKALRAALHREDGA